MAKLHPRTLLLADRPVLRLQIPQGQLHLHSILHLPYDVLPQRADLPRQRQRPQLHTHQFRPSKHFLAATRPPLPHPVSSRPHHSPLVPPARSLHPQIPVHPPARHPQIHHLHLPPRRPRPHHIASPSSAFIPSSPNLGPSPTSSASVLLLRCPTIHHAHHAEYRHPHPLRPILAMISTSSSTRP